MRIGSNSRMSRARLGREATVRKAPSTAQEYSVPSWGLSRQSRLADVTQHGRYGSSTPAQSRDQPAAVRIIVVVGSATSARKASSTTSPADRGKRSATEKSVG